MRDLIARIVLCLILDSRQNNGVVETRTLLIVLCLILDSRQNTHNHNNTSRYIVLCLILDSRQNGNTHITFFPEIVLCLILDSRQNTLPTWFCIEKLYCALFWIQGKTRICRRATR